MRLHFELVGYLVDNETINKTVSKYRRKFHDIVFIGFAELDYEEIS